MTKKKRIIISSIILNIIGALGFLLAPLILGILVDGYGLSDAQAGYFISFLILGIMIGSITMYSIGVRLNQQLIRAGALLLGAVSFLMVGLLKEYYLLFGLAVVTGFAGGILSSANFILLSRTSNANKNFSLLMFLMTSVGAISFVCLTYVVSVFGSESIFLTFAIIYILALPLVLFIEPILKNALPALGNVLDAGKAAPVKHGPWLSLTVVFFTYLSIGAFWPYAERVGLASGLDAEQIGILLGSGLILTLIGCVVASKIGDGKRGANALRFALIALGLVFFIFGTVPIPYAYVICILVFYFLWNMVDIFELGVLSSQSQEGKHVALVPAFQALGGVMGPAVGASFLTLDWGLKSVMYFACISVFIAFSLLIYINNQLDEK